MDLSPAALLREWRSGKFRPVYYLLGEESAAKVDALIELKKLFKADDFNLFEFAGEPVSESAAVVSEAMTLPVFAERRRVIVRSPKLPAEARAAYRQAVEKGLPNSSYRNVVQIKLDALGSGT